MVRAIWYSQGDSDQTNELSQVIRDNN